MKNSKRIIPLTLIETTEQGFYYEYELELENERYTIAKENERFALLKLSASGWEVAIEDPLEFIIKNNLKLGE